MMQQDALQRIRDQVKEELKEELKNQIRQELIDQLPKESQDVLAKKVNLKSATAKNQNHKPSKFAMDRGPQLSEAVESNDSQNPPSQDSLVKHEHVASGNGSLKQYKFGMISGEDPQQNDRNSKNSKQSRQSQQHSVQDSEDQESERLRKSYDEYGKMINEKNKRFDYKKGNPQPIFEGDDSDQNDSVEVPTNKRPNMKQNRSASLACNDNQQDLLAKQLDQIKMAEKRKERVKRNNSIHVGNIMGKRESRCGTEGGQDHIRNFEIAQNQGYFDNDDVPGTGYDHLQIQIEDERLKLLNEILALVQDNREDDIDESNINNKLKLMCKNMMDLNIDYNVSKMLELSKKDKRILRELIKKYQEILMHQSKYVNVEYLDNELKSDVDADYDDEEEEEEGQSSSDQQESSSEDGVENRSNSYRGQKKKKKKPAETENEDNSDNDVQYESYKPKIDPKAMKLRNERRGSIMSIGSRRVKQMEESKKMKKKMKKQFESESNDEDEDSVDIDAESNSDEEEEKKPEEIAKSPSLQEIGRCGSYKSIDSKMRQQAKKKFDPKLLKIRDDGSCRGSIKSRSSRASKKAFMQDLVSERSGNRRQLSIYRRDKLQGLELDYHEYLQQYQGIFIIRCQMMNIELSKIREKYDLEKMMIEFKNFKKLQKEIKQDEVYRGLQTVIIDIENTFVTLLDVKNKEELDAIKEYDNFASDYIIIKKNVSKKSKKDKSKSKADESKEEDICCEYKGSERCICDLLVYQVRPYTYEILRAIQPFFEIVVFSKLHHKVLEHIIDHIESILNKPIKEFLEKYQKSMNKSSFQRMKKLPDVKIYFQYIIHQRQYIHIKDHDKHIENLLVLTKNRPKDNLIFISSNPFRIVTAIKYGFLTIPVIQFESFYRDDYQLSLVEHYILKIRHLKDMKKRLRQDFKCLVQKIDNQPVKVPNYIKNLQSSSKNFETQSQGSFGGKKLKKVQEKKESVKQMPVVQPPPPPPVVKKVDPALLKSNKPASVNQLKGQFKPRKSSFGNISFDGFHKGQQPQNSSGEDMEDYDEEECEEKIKQLENEIKNGYVEDKPKKKLLFTKIEENKIEENEEKEEEPEQNNLSFKQPLNNPQEQAHFGETQKNGNQQDLMQYNFQVASMGNHSFGETNKDNNPFYRPGLEHLEKNGSGEFMKEEKKKMSSFSHQVDKPKEQLQKDSVNIVSNNNSGPVIVNQGSIVMNINKNVIQRTEKAKNSTSSMSSTEKSGSSRRKQDNESESVNVPSNEEEKQSLRAPSGHHSFSEESSGNVKFIQGKVLYDANMVILEESKDQSCSAVIPLKSGNRPSKHKTQNSEMKSSNIASDIDELYAELDKESQNAQMQKINEEIENSGEH